MIAEALQLAAGLNLACSGIEISGRIDHGMMRDRREAPFSTTFRVDPVAKLWCADDCSAVKPLHGTSDKLITFEFAWEKDVQLISSVSLENGELLLNDRDKRHWTVRRGTCRPAAFTGFPEGAAP